MLPHVPDRADDQQQDCSTHDDGRRTVEKEENIQEWHGAFRQRISHEKEEKKMSLTSHCVRSYSAVSDTSVGLTIFDNDHDLLRCPARVIRHPERQEAK
jgi:hypothetical protein